MTTLWTEIPNGHGYLLRLSREGQLVIDGERGKEAQLRLATQLVGARDRLERPATVHWWKPASATYETVGVPPCVLHKRIQKRQRGRYDIVRGY